MKKIAIISIFAASLLYSNGITFNEADSNIKRISPIENSENTILSYHDSIANAKKSVVNISTTKTIRTSQNGIEEMFNDPFFKEFFGFNFGIPYERQQKSSSLGSGVIISKDGYIVTNNHVIEDSDEIIVTLPENHKDYKAKIIGTDSKTDLAVIKIEDNNLNAIKLADSSKILEGDVVFAIGNPFGVGSSITRGIISALNKNNIGLNQYENFIQTDASINPGNSGGALVDSRGALIGINSAILSRGGDSSGIGFAIPSSMVKNVAQKLISDGKIERGYIGVMIANLTEDQKELYKNKEGALISSVEKDFPADKAGIKRGDLIIAINDKDIKSANDLKNTIGSIAPNTEVSVTYERSKKISKTKMKLANMSLNASNAKDIQSIEGLSVSNINDELKRRYKLNSDITGILVTDVKQKSKASDIGFLRGDIIVQVGEDIIKDIDSFTKAIKSTNGQKTLVWVNRNSIMQGLVIK
ncbi:periplasmic heat shock serine protease HtrA, Do family [Campylobacter pinnipediorum subsp. caledonicus]|uniref:Periplasmic heat shock serine protease HtrA, Do family n=1 Tax=Campylobacter pinnipediorum subsp. caledonicus TaxID=1874362 RepID=A0A1S6U7H6_9BACT|nr:Do family serine endopeptidase [Campylobacter pinnipediorum]AQW87704.1 periplasmic heat shock serine protease HtrA, Do family [Campylobacter pinnipediorum subsp. caledonicus]